MSQFFALAPARKGLLAAMGLVLTAAFAVGQFGPQGPGGPRFGPQGPGGPRFGPQGGPGGPRDDQQMVQQYQCSGCKQNINVANGQEVPKKCPHCGVNFSWVRDESGKVVKRMNSTAPAALGIVLGILCVIVVIAAGIGGVILLVRMLTPKKTRRRKRKPPRRFEDDDDDDDDDDRPRRRSRRDDD